MKYTHQRVITVTAEDVYHDSNPPIPEGYESTGEFRPPQTGELLLASYETKAMRASIDFQEHEPRIILRKKKIKRIIYTQVRTGTPQPGEFYPSNGENGEVMFKCKPGNDDYMKNNYPNVPIFKREEEEI